MVWQSFIVSRIEKWGIGNRTKPIKSLGPREQPIATKRSGLNHEAPGNMDAPLALRSLRKPGRIPPHGVQATVTSNSHHILSSAQARRKVRGSRNCWLLQPGSDPMGRSSWQPNGRGLVGFAAQRSKHVPGNWARGCFRPTKSGNMLQHWAHDRVC